MTPRLEPPQGGDKSLRQLMREAYERATPAEREESLEAATRYLDGLPFKGKRKTAIQSLAWPRSGAFRADGSEVIGIPPEMEEANYIVAGMLLAKIPYTPEAASIIAAVLKDVLQEGVEIFEGPITRH